MTADLSLATQLDLALRLTVGLILGAIIGFERELHRQPAGFRTHSLVSLGAALFTVVSAFGFGGDLVDRPLVAGAIGTERHRRQLDVGPHDELEVVRIATVALRHLPDAGPHRRDRVDRQAGRLVDHDGLAIDEDDTVLKRHAAPMGPSRN